MMRFLALSADAAAYYDGLEQRRLNARHDLLDIDIAPPDLSAYEVNDHDPD